MLSGKQYHREVYSNDKTLTAGLHGLNLTYKNSPLYNHCPSNLNLSQIHKIHAMRAHCNHAQKRSLQSNKRKQTQPLSKTRSHKNYQNLSHSIRNRDHSKSPTHLYRKLGHRCISSLKNNHIILQMEIIFRRSKLLEA